MDQHRGPQPKSKFSTVKQLFWSSFIAVFLVTQAAFVLKSVLHVRSFSEALEKLEIEGRFLRVVSTMADSTISHPKLFDSFALIGLVTTLLWMSYVLYKLISLVTKFFKLILTVLAVMALVPIVVFILIKMEIMSPEDLNNPAIKFVKDLFGIVVFVVKGVLAKGLAKLTWA
ncbi:hypothetical protein P9112_009306 [Eukaryota sp. TZLM1-RC]